MIRWYRAIIQNDRNRLERARRLAEFWNWLPAFRAVAETGHLGEASRALNVSPSALSRTIRLLESRLGRPLFDRVGRRIVLNSDGRRLVTSVRDAMRRIDDEVDGLTRPDPRIRISAGALLVRWLLLPTLAALRSRDAEVVPLLFEIPTRSVNEAVLSGTVDIALVDRVTADPNVRAERLGTYANGVFAGRRHPSALERRPTTSQILGHPFAVATSHDAAGPTDVWPADQTRRVGLDVAPIHLGPEVCEDGSLLAVLPEPFGRSSGRLRRLPFPLPPTTLFAVIRPPVGPTPRVVALIALLRQRLGPHRRRAREP